MLYDPILLSFPKKTITKNVITFRYQKMQNEKQKTKNCNITKWASAFFLSFFNLQGMLVLTLTAAISTWHPPHCGGEEIFLKCRGPTTSQMAFLLTGFGLLIIGAGGIRPCNLAFGADQFNPKTESGKRGMNSFFNWYYFTYTFAMMVSLTVIIYVQSDISWALGLAIPTILMLLSCVMFFLGTRIYVKVRPDGSPLTSVVQVMVASFKKRRVKLPNSPWVSL